MSSSCFLSKEESKKPCYILFGDQIKYEPAWVKNYNNDGRKSIEVTNKNIIVDTGTEACLKSITLSLGQTQALRARSKLQSMNSKKLKDILHNKV